MVAAVEAQVRRGSAFAAPTETEVELAEEIRRRVPSIERLRFTSSGTEATMFAIRAARAFTGRPLIARFERSYHGTHDGVMVGTAGVPGVMSELIVDLPWGDPDGIEAALRGRERELAAIIIEPVQGAGGVRAPEPDFLPFLRSFTDRHGALLIFDEIISFRVAPGGAQARFGVRPDLTTLGKIIGGGYPLAAFGGRADVMDIFDAASAGRGQPRRDVQRQSRGGRRRSGDAARADAGDLRPARCARRAPAARALTAAIERDGLDARVDDRRVALPGLLGRGRDRVRDRRDRRRVAVPRPAARRVLPRAARDGGDPGDRRAESDIDDLAAAIGRVLVALDRVREPATA